MLLMVTGIMLPVFSSAGNSDSRILVTSYDISLNTAMRAAKAAIVQCERLHYQVAVTVVDRAGEQKVVLRNDLVPDMALGISLKKAVTAHAFARATSVLRQREVSKMLRSEDVLLFADGGLPIMAAGIVIGAIGVSGAPSGEIDEQCAKSGIDAIAEDLEFADP